MFSNHLSAQYFAQKSYELLSNKCKDHNNQKTSRKEIRDLCRLQHNEENRLRIVKSNLGQVSENAYLASLAQIKIEQVKCLKSEISNLKQDEKNKKAVLNDFVQKIFMLGEHKRLLNEYRNKNHLTDDEKQRYEVLLKSAITIEKNISFAELEPFKKIIQYSMLQFDMYTPDRLDKTLPIQIEKQFNQAIDKSMTMLNENEMDLNQGIRTFGESFSDSSKENLAQDEFLIGTYRSQNADIESELENTMCQVNAKYGQGAKTRDQLISAGVVLGTFGTGILSRLASTAIEANLLRSSLIKTITPRTVAIARLTSSLSLSSVAVAEAFKSCDSVEDKIQLNHENQKQTACLNHNIKSVGHENCLLSKILAATQIVHLFPILKHTSNFINKSKTIKNTRSLQKIETETIAQTRQVTTNELTVSSKKTITTAQENLSKEKIAKSRPDTSAAVSRKKSKSAVIDSDEKKLKSMISLESEIDIIEKKLLQQGGSAEQLAQLKLIRKELDSVIDFDLASSESKLNELRNRLRNLQSSELNTVVQDKTMNALDSLSSFADNQKVQVMSGHFQGDRYVQISSKVFESLKSEEKITTRKFLESISKGLNADKIDSTKIKFLGGIESGEKGRVFEVRVVTRGHKRLFGCFKDGVYSILAYNPQTPTTVAGVNVLYKDLCK